jgi:hypothetical protein
MEEAISHRTIRKCPAFVDLLSLSVSLIYRLSTGAHEQRGKSFRTIRHSIAIARLLAHMIQPMDVTLPGPPDAVLGWVASLG